jgi:hypothetical protein
MDRPDSKHDYELSSSQVEMPSADKKEPPSLVVALSEEPGFIGAYLAIALQIAVIAVLASFPFLNIFLRSVGTLSSTDHSLYVVGTTVLASLVAAYTTGTVRKLMTFELARSGSYKTSQLRQTRTVLGLASIRDQLHSWSVALAFLVAGLLTTAIVGGLTPIVTLGMCAIHSQTDPPLT